MKKSYNKKWHREYWLKNKVHLSEGRKLRMKTAIGRFAQLKGQAKLRKISFNLNKEWFEKWYKLQNNICHYCGRKLKYESHNHDLLPSVDRKNNNLGYTPKNIVLCCLQCNHIKRECFTYKEMKLIGRILKKIYVSK